ncbi:MAG: DUF5596 domain-containing protein, partial [Clostridia bacterium]|nr:DUF5596 domain-containing protein [Clostridia bacterium]
MKFFIEEILQNEELKTLLLTDEEMSARGKEMAEKIIEAQDNIPMEGGILPLFTLAHLSDYTLALHEKLGIPHEVTVATLRDVNNWVHNYQLTHNGELGFNRMGWLSNHALGRLFRLGRLQFVHAKPHPVVPSDKYVIEVHIPQGEPLDIDACLESFKMAKEFFARLYPDKPADHFVCGSWLLSPDLPAVCDEDSNICRFMCLWTQLPHNGDKGRQALERVFGFNFDPADIASAPENTSLQRRLKAHVLAGGMVES